MVGGSYFLSCKKEDPGPEIPFDGTVAVIGGGLAGLCAADVLNAKESML
jgi:threonine dehydrogenase-like Zn-dependent dehydrogenase